MARLKGERSVYRPGERIPTVVLQAPKGMTRADAYELLKSKAVDYRGFTYNPKTGRATFT